MLNQRIEKHNQQSGYVGLSNRGTNPCEKPDAKDNIIDVSRGNCDDSDKLAMGEWDCVTQFGKIIWKEGKMILQAALRGHANKQRKGGNLWSHYRHRQTWPGTPRH